MAYNPIANYSTQFVVGNYGGWYLKAYAQGTTTPISIATDSAGGTLLAKAYIDLTTGFIKTASGGTIFIPHLNAAYDLWIFPTSTEADADDTANAVQIADNMLALAASDSLEWGASGIAATYISATTFSVVGDQTAIFVEGQELKTTGGADRRSTVDSAVYGSVTTVTVRNVQTMASPPVASTLHASMDTVYLNVNGPNYAAISGTRGFSRYEYYNNNVIIAGVHFACVADGVTDNLSSLNTFLAGLLTDTRGATIVFPGGSSGAYYFDNSAGGIIVGQDNIEFRGINKPNLKSSTDSQHLINCTADGFKLNNCQLSGPGTFVDDTSSYGSLLYITGQDSTIESCTFTDPPTCGVYYYGALDCKFLNNIVEGGPSAYSSTAHFGVRAIDSYKLKVTGNTFRKKSGGGQQTQGIFVSATAGGTDIDGDTDTAGHDILISNNYFLNCNDHAVYCNAVSRVILTGNTAKYTFHTSYVVGNSYLSGTQRVGNVVSNNIASNYASGYGIVLRDSNACICTNNVLDGGGTGTGGIQITPVDYSGTLNANVISGNTIINFTTYGIQFLKTSGAFTVTEVFDNLITNNVIDTGTTAAGDMSTTGAGITMNISKTGATYVSQRNTIKDNKILTSPNWGILIATSTGCEISGNTIRNPGAATSATGRSGILSQTNIYLTVAKNKIVDDLGSHLMLYGIEGNNDTTYSKVDGNEVSGATSVPIRQFQQASSGNEFRANRVGTDPLTGTFTASAATTTVVTNNNAQGGSGYTNYVQLIPTNAAAAALMAGSDSLYRSTQTAGTSFTLATAGGGSAAGTETFRYEIIG